MSLLEVDAEKAEKRNGRALLLCYLPEPLKEKLRSRCAESGTSMSRTVVELIRDMLEGGRRSEEKDR